MENNKNMTLQQEMLERNASSEKSIWKAKMIFEVITVVLLCVFVYAFFRQLGGDDPAWTFNAIVTLIALVACVIMTNCLDYYCGGYRCEKCGHIHVPSKGAIFNANGILNKKYLECPQCGQKSWQTKMLMNVEQPVNQENQVR